MFFINYIKKLIIILFGFLNRVIHLCFDVSLKEPHIQLQLFSKSPRATLWIYIYAPDKYHLKKEIISLKCKDNVIVENSPNNPILLSYRVGRKNSKQYILPINMSFHIQIPIMDYIWLTSIDKLLLLFLFIWLFACFKYVFPISIFQPFFNLTFNIVKFPGILESTFVLIGFILLARSWFFHESTIYHIASIKFAIILVILTCLCLFFIFLGIIYV
jgi:hypothetical protein